MQEKFKIGDAVMVDPKIQNGLNKGVIWTVMKVYIDNSVLCIPQFIPKDLFLTVPRNNGKSILSEFTVFQPNEIIKI